MKDNDPQQNDNLVQIPVYEEPAPENAGISAESPKPRPAPSYGEITEGESGASLWKTLKMALRE